MSGDLTPIRRKILEAIVAYEDEHGYTPTIREIGAAVGLASTSSVHAQLLRLEADGYLRRGPTKRTPLVVTDLPDREEQP